MGLIQFGIWVGTRSERVYMGGSGECDYVTVWTFPLYDALCSCTCSACRSVKESLLTSVLRAPTHDG